MPIFRYPRYGLRIAPERLRSFLDVPVDLSQAPLSYAIQSNRRTAETQDEDAQFRLSDLDATAWERFTVPQCRALAQLVIRAISRRLPQIRTQLGHELMQVPDHIQTLDLLYLEPRTRNRLYNHGLHGVDGAALLRLLKLNDVLDLLGFGAKSLVDLLVSLESATCTSPAPSSTQQASGESHSWETIFSQVLPSGYIPSPLESRRLPSLPGPVSVQQLSLCNRTYNALQKAGLADDLTLISNLTLGDLHRLRGFGRQCLVDFLQSIERFIRGIPSRAAYSSWEAVFSQVRPNGEVPSSRQSRTLPPLPNPLSIQQLDVTNRTRSALTNAGLADDLNLLGNYTLGDLLRLKGFGPLCLVDLLESIKGYLRGPLARTVRPSSPGKLHKAIRRFSRIKGASDISPSDPRLGTLARSIVANGPIRSKIRNLEPGSTETPAFLSLSKKAHSLAKLSLESEFLDLCSDGATKQRAMLTALYGLDGARGQTLASIGKRFGVTSERVRQICCPSWMSGSATIPFAPKLDNVLGFLARRVHDEADTVAMALSRRSLTSKTLRVETILRIAKALGRRPNLVVVRIGATRFVSSERDSRSVNQLVSHARKMVAKFGAISTEQVADAAANLYQMSLGEDRIRCMLRALAGFRWLDENSGWFWLAPAARNALKRRIGIVLAVAPTIRINELRDAMRRDYHSRGGVPPPHVLLELCRQLPECSVNGDEIRAVGNFSNLVQGDELKIVAFLSECGGLCRGADLATYAKQAGISEASFWAHLTYSPVLRRLASGVYGLVGAPVPPGKIESLMPIRARGARVMQAHGWTRDGGIWVSYKLAASTIKSGVVSSSAAKQSLVGGSFSLKDKDGKSIGRLVARGNLAWGLGPFLRESGAEPGDYLILEYRAAERIAIARLGDEGILDDYVDDQLVSNEGEENNT